jgi:hypothetical protein
MKNVQPQPLNIYQSCLSFLSTCLSPSCFNDHNVILAKQQVKPYMLPHREMQIYYNEILKNNVVGYENMWDWSENNDCLALHASLSQVYHNKYEILKDVEEIVKNYFTYKSACELHSALLRFNTLKGVVDREKLIVDALNSVLDYKQNNFLRITSQEERYDNYISNLENGTDTVVLNDTVFNSIADNSIRKQGLITVAARSGGGKSYFSTYLALEFAKVLDKKNILVLDYEMYEDVQTQRELQLQGYTDDLEGAIKARKDLEQKQGRILYIEGAATDKKIDTVCQMAKIYNCQYPLGVIVVDYIACLHTDNNSQKYLSITEQADKLSNLAQELNCIIIAPTQINRDYKNRDKNNIQEMLPKTTDASYSSGLEQKSNLWLGIGTPENDPTALYVVCRKNRYGAKDNIGMYRFRNGQLNPAPYQPQPSEFKSQLEKLK